MLSEDVKKWIVENRIRHLMIGQHGTEYLRALRDDPERLTNVFLQELEAWTTEAAIGLRKAVIVEDFDRASKQLVEASRETFDPLIKKLSK